MQEKERTIDSVKKRYLITLISNGILFLMRVTTAGIVPRALGPEQLGDFGFLSKISNSIRTFLNLGTSSAFFNYNAKHDKTGPLVKSYSVWLVGQLTVSLSLVLLAVLFGIKEQIWPGQQFKFIIWVIVFDWVFFLVNILKQLSDSKGFTARAQIINMIIGVVNIALLVFFAFTNNLDLSRYIAIQTICSVLISLLIIKLVIIPNRDLFWTGQIRGRIKEFSKYFYNFCHPLFVITLVGFAFSFLDRYLLQRFFGSTQQGFFHIASSWSALATIFTASILSIYKRELAHSIGKNNTARASEIFARYIKMMYFVTLTLAIFLVFNAKTLLGLIAGPEFVAATTVLIIMALYPVLQVYGQLGGAAFYATERTAALRNITIVSKLLGIPLTYFLLAPSSLAIPGLGLGANGLALKMVIWSFIVIQFYIISNCRYFKIKPSVFWWHQLYSFSIVFALMFLTRFSVGILLARQGFRPGILTISIEAVFYFSALAAIIFSMPQIAGIARHEIFSIFNDLKNKMKFSI